MKTKLITVIFFSFFSALGIAQNYTDRPSEPFTKIVINGACNVYYKQSDSTRLRIGGGTESQMEAIDTKFEDGVLYISSHGKMENTPVILINNNSALTSVNCQGASSFRSTNTLKTESISFNATGAANIDATLDVNNVSGEISGAASMKLSGITDNFDVGVTGAASLKAYDLVSKAANVTTSGASTARVYVTSKLVAKASGASSIKVKGEVKDVIAETSSAASVTRVADDSYVISGNTNTKGKEDSTTISLGNTKLIITGEGKHNKGRIIYRGFDHWAGFSIGVNGLLTPDASTTMEKPYGYMDLDYSRCINLQFNPFQYNMYIYKKYVILVTGVGIEWRRYMLDNKTILNPDSSFTWGIIDSTKNIKYDKNAFKSALLQVPLLLEFNTSGRSSKSFHVAAGVIGQFLISSKIKQVVEVNGNKVTRINKDNYNLNTLNLKAHVGVGYSDFMMFAEYNLTSLFQKNEGPQLYPFTVGVRLIGL